MLGEKMNPKDIMINDISLDKILKHYYAIGVLIQHAKNTKEFGGQKALWEWDIARDKNLKYNIIIKIDRETE